MPYLACYHYKKIIVKSTVIITKEKTPEESGVFMKNNNHLPVEPKPPWSLAVSDNSFTIS